MRSVGRRLFEKAASAPQQSLFVAVAPDWIGIEGPTVFTVADTCNAMVKWRIVVRHLKGPLSAKLAEACNVSSGAGLAMDSDQQTP